MPRLSRQQLSRLHEIGITAWVRRDGPASGKAYRSVDDGADPAWPEPVTPASTPEPGIEAMDWEALAAAVNHCERCPLHRSRTQGVFGTGDHAARLMVIGEAPGADEDRLGEPFVGRGGRLLDEMLTAIGLARETVYITNILKSRPPDNRDPTVEEVAACEPYLKRQIELLSPEVILAMGRVAAQHLIGSASPLGRLRGAWHSYGPHATPLWVSYHPAYLLRRPAEKRKAWQDLKTLRDRLRANAAQPGNDSGSAGPRGNTSASPQGA